MFGFLEERKAEFHHPVDGRGRDDGNYGEHGSWGVNRSDS